MQLTYIYIYNIQYIANFMLFCSRLQMTKESRQLLVCRSHRQRCRLILSTTFFFHLELMLRLIWMKWLVHRVSSRIMFHEFGTTRQRQTITTTVYHEQFQLGCRQSRFTSAWCNPHIPRRTCRTPESVIPSVAFRPGCRQPRRFAARIWTWAAAARWIAVSITIRVWPVYRTQRRQCRTIDWSTALRSPGRMACRSTQLVSRTRKCGTTAGRVSSRDQAVKLGVHHRSVLAATRVICITARSRTFQPPSLTPSTNYFILSCL